MKKYNQGMTMIEILMSVIIIGIVLLFLFAMLIQVRREDQQNTVQSDFLINQATFVKRVSEDIANYGLLGVSSCNLTNMGTSEDAVDPKADYICLRLEYGKGYIKDRIGYLTIYRYRANQNTGEYAWLVKYSRGYYRQCDLSGRYSYWEETNRLGKQMSSAMEFGEGAYVNYTAFPNNSEINSVNIVVPIIDESGDHYDLELPFIYTNAQGFYCEPAKSTSSARAPLRCNCLGGNCNQTKKFTYTCDY